MQAEGQQQVFVLQQDHELRVEVEYGQEATIMIRHGTAEVFGTELPVKRPYKFTGNKFAIFTWHGCELEINGQYQASVATQTSMVYYLSVHEYLERMRIHAQALIDQNTPIDRTRIGPRVLVAGPMDSGKSTVCKVLLNYASRLSRKPVYVDLDTGQGNVTIPGMLGAISVERPSEPADWFANSIPLVYFYGTLSPNDNSALFKRRIDNLASQINRRMIARPEVAASGMVVNTCGWIDGLGYQLLVYSIYAMTANIVLVMDNEKLFSDLQNEFSGKPIEVVKMARFSGACTRQTPFRRHTRTRRFREYFYGIANDLCPHQVVVSFDDLSIYSIGDQPSTPGSQQLESKGDPLVLNPVTPNENLKHSIMGVSRATALEQVLDDCLAGFVCVTEVDMDKRTLMLLAPSPGPLPSSFLLVGSLKWTE